MKNIKIIFIIIIAGLVLIAGCVQKNNSNENSDDGSMPENSFMVCETFTIYQETNPSLLPADSIEKVEIIKNNLPKCPIGGYQPGCIIDEKEYEIEESNYPDSYYRIVRADRYGVPIIILANGTAIWRRCVY